MRVSGSVVEGTLFICTVCDCTRRRLKYVKGKSELFKRKDGKLPKKSVIGLQGPAFMVQVFFPARDIVRPLFACQDDCEFGCVC